MKTKLFALALTLLTLFSACAFAEIDLTPYLVSDQEMTRIKLIRPGLILQLYQSWMVDARLSPETTVTLWENGQQAAVYPLKTLDQDENIMDYQLWAVSENLYGYISEEPEQVLHVLAGNGAVSEIPLHAKRETPLECLFVLRDYFCCLRGLNALECYDWNGQLLFSFDLQSDVLHILDSTQLENGDIAFLVRDDDGIRLYRFNPIQKTSEQTLISVLSEDHSYRGYLGDDGRSSLIKDNPRDTYMIAPLTRRSAQGDVLWSKTLQAKKLVVSVNNAILHDDGSTTLYGTAMANSRGIYTAFILEVDAQGDIVSKDVRDFTTTATYLYNMALDTQNHPYVVSLFAGAASPETGGGNKCAVVPFENLPTCDDPGLVLE